MGDPARRDEARRRGHPRDHPAARPRTCATGWSAAARGTSSSPRRPPAAFDDVARRLHPDRGRRRAAGLARLRRGRRGVRRSSRPTASPAPPTRCCSTSPPAPPRGPSSSSTPTPPTRSGTCRRCTGSGCEPGDVHLNISSPGWAKHAWSNVFAPWNAEACVLVMNYARFDAEGVLDVLDRCQVTSFCAPPTVWRMLIQADLTGLRCPPAKVVGAGEPLNPEVIEQVERAWGVRIRDGFGQTETTVQIANTPGPAGEAGLDGPADARLHGRADRPGHRGAGGRGRDLPRPQGPAAGPDGRLPGDPDATAERHGRRVLPHRRRRDPRRRRLHHLRRPRGRRVQGQRLPHLARSSWRAC